MKKLVNFPIVTFLLFIPYVLYAYYLCELTEKHTESNNIEFSGELMKWHKITLTSDGPETSENDEINPFMNFCFVFGHLII